jgi:hypothetical protein
MDVWILDGRVSLLCTRALSGPNVHRTPYAVHSTRLHFVRWNKGTIRIGCQCSNYQPSIGVFSRTCRIKAQSFYGWQLAVSHYQPEELKFQQKKKSCLIRDSNPRPLGFKQYTPKKNCILVTNPCSHNGIYGDDFIFVIRFDDILKFLVFNFAQKNIYHTLNYV